MADAAPDKPNTIGSAANVRGQTKLMNSAGSAWHAVKVGNLEKITNLFPAHGDVYAQGPVGENVFHIAMLLNTPTSLAIARYLIRVYGRQLVNTPYQERRRASDPPGLYEGETALHIAIVNHDLDFVKLLVNSGAYVRARAYGGFFNIKGPCYYGEYPLSFAASTGQADVVQYLTRHGARPDLDADLLGNTALHMCVYHTQPDMYNLLLELGAVEQLENNDGMSCLLLAARLGNATMFQYICDRNRQVSWQYGPVTSYILALREIDTVQAVKANPKLRQSALKTVVHQRHRHMLEIPLINTLFRIKWNSFGFVMFLLDAAAHCASVALCLAIVLVRLSGRDAVGYRGAADAALQYALLCVVLFHIANAANDCWFEVQHTLTIESIRHATMTYVPPTYPIPSSEPSQQPPAEPVAEGQERISQDVATFMSLHSSTDCGADDDRAASGSRASARGGWRAEGAYQELSNAAMSAAHTRRLLQPSWARSQPDSALRQRGAGAAGAGARGGAVAEEVCVPMGAQAVGEGREGSSLRDFAEEVWHSVIHADPGAPRSVSQNDLHDLDLDPAWGRQGTHLRHGINAGQDSVQSVAPTLFHQLMNYDGDMLGPELGDDIASVKGNLPVPTAAPKPKATQVHSTVPSPMSPGAVAYAVLRFALKSVRGADDLPRALLFLYYAFALVECLVWIGQAGRSGKSQTHGQLVSVDALLSASLCLGFAGVATFFARGWRTPGALVVAMTMALERLTKLFVPAAGIILALSFGVATVVMGAGNAAAVQAAFPGASFFGVVWACWCMLRSEYAPRPSAAALYAVLGRDGALLSEWEAAMVWAMYLALQLAVLLIAAMAVAVCVSVLRDQLGAALELWKLQWCSYIIRLEYRLPEHYRQKYRIGDKGYSSHWRRQVYIYQYEEIDHGASAAKASVDKDAKKGAASAQDL